MLSQIITGIQFRHREFFLFIFLKQHIPKKSNLNPILPVEKGVLKKVFFTCRTTILSLWWNLSSQQKSKSTFSSVNQTKYHFDIRQKIRVKVRSFSGSDVSGTDYSKFRRTFSALHFEISSNMAKKNCGYPKPRFQVPVPPLISTFPSFRF